MEASVSGSAHRPQACTTTHDGTTDDVHRYISPDNGTSNDVWPDLVADVWPDLVADLRAAIAEVDQMLNSTARAASADIQPPDAAKEDSQEHLAEELMGKLFGTLGRPMSPGMSPTMMPIGVRMVMRVLGLRCHSRCGGATRPSRRPLGRRPRQAQVAVQPVQLRLRDVVGRRTAPPRTPTPEQRTHRCRLHRPLWPA